MSLNNLKYITLVTIIFVVFVNSNGQYFGQNKPSYKQFEFKLYKTPNFEIYHYLKSDSLVKHLAKRSEQWYLHHQQLLLDTFKVRNPILIYSNHADFQQTNAINSLIGVGTGGVTEGIKKRIVMPLSFSAYQTDHVLGHEMVHVFQYDILQRKEGLGLTSIKNIPLWMIEGMAEYLSVGNYDSHTSLWMRDALIHNKFPTLKQMTVSYKYSPYRYGQAFWSYIANTYGEQYLLKLFLETAEKGVKRAISDVFLMSMDTLSANWKNSIKKHLLSNVNDSVFVLNGEKIITKKNGGRYNLLPSVSPDGENMIFLSEKDLFDLDLFLADAHTGEVKSKIYSSTYSDKIDGINYLESAGTWSNNGKLFAYLAYTKGESSIIIFDVEKRKIKDEIFIEELDAISYPSWSPTENVIALTGLKEGVSDLYLYNLKTNELKNITNDVECNFQACWDKTGNIIYYVTDAPSNNQLFTSNKQYNIASLNLKTNQKTVYSTFDGAQNINPTISGDGSDIYFLSDRDETRNIYWLNIKTQKIFQLTHYATGITGMTSLSPAMDIAKGNLYYNMLWDGEFTIVKTQLNQNKKLATLVTDKKVDFYASRLMPYSKYPSVVDDNLTIKNFAFKTDSFYTEKVKSKFKLDYIGNTGAGIMTGRFGTGMAGSVEARFSDILSEHMLYTGVSINGEIYDFGGQFAYVNQKRPIKKGVSLSHIPYRTGFYGTNGDDSDSARYYFQRIFIDKLSLFGYYSFNKAHRVELGLSAANYSYRTERLEGSYYYYSVSSTGKELVESPPSFGVGIFDAAYVIDNSKFGLTAPVEGKRIRLAYERFVKGVNMNTILFDYRKYFHKKPYTFALRLYHHGRYGKESDSDKLYDMYIGYPWYIRGYESGAFYGSEKEGKISVNQLLGSKMMLTNFEFRMPFSGPKNYALLSSNYFYSDLALFFDAGMAWDNNSTPQWSFVSDSPNKRIPLMSIGAALRFNVLGVIILEPYYAFPLHQGVMHQGNFGFNILSGW